MCLDFKGKNAVVTGSGNGIGATITEKYLERGANVALVDINREVLMTYQHKLQKTYSNAKIMIYPCDISVEKEVQENINKIISDFEVVDILVNCAGIVKIGSLIELPVDDWDMTMAVNLRGTYLFCRYLIPEMRKKQSGKIVTISSQAGKKPVFLEGHYSVSKAAVNMLTQCLAIEVAKDNINVNAVCPGSVEGELNSTITTERAKILGITSAEFLQNTINNTPLGRQVYPEEIAELVLFLCSSKASFMTGQAINITGGRIFN